MAASGAELDVRSWRICDSPSLGCTRFRLEPAQLPSQSSKSTIYRREAREMAEGGRIRFTVPEKDNHIRTGDFATMERIEPDLSVRLDSGKTVDLDTEAAQHIDYGYAVGTAGNLAADRVILTGQRDWSAHCNAAGASWTETE